MAEEIIKPVSPNVESAPGGAGLETQLPGQATTVTAIAEAGGGLGGENLIQADIDEAIFQFDGADTPLLDLTLKAKTIPVDSAEVDHCMIDKKVAFVETNAVVNEGDEERFILPLPSAERRIPQRYGTLLVNGVDGYDNSGAKKTPGRPLMLFVVGRDVSGNLLVTAINGKKGQPKDAACKTPAIPAGTKITLMGNAMSETQKIVDPSSILPVFRRLFLQKRGMNRIVSDYFESQAKRIPFSDAVMAEDAIRNYKIEGNRTALGGRQGKITVEVEGMGPETIYFTEGLRWQIVRILKAKNSWTIEKIISLAKMYYTGEDKPKVPGTMLCGKNMLEGIQCIDFSKHPEVKIEVKTNHLGWSITSLHTVFGDIHLKHEPAFDAMGWSNSAMLLSHDRIVRYQRKADSSFNEEVEGREAKRSGIISWEGYGLKGTCHIWIDGEGEALGADEGAVSYVQWESDKAPTGSDLVEGLVYYLIVDCPGIHATAQNGQTWQYKGGKWSEFTGSIYGG